MSEILGFSTCIFMIYDNFIEPVGIIQEMNFTFSAVILNAG